MNVFRRWLANHTTEGRTGRKWGQGKKEESEEKLRKTAPILGRVEGCFIGHFWSKATLNPVCCWLQVALRIASCAPIGQASISQTQHPPSPTPRCWPLANGGQYLFNQSTNVLWSIICLIWKLAMAGAPTKGSRVQFLRAVHGEQAVVRAEFGITYNFFYAFIP